MKFICYLVTTSLFIIGSASSFAQNDFSRFKNSEFAKKASTLYTSRRNIVFQTEPRSGYNYKNLALNHLNVEFQSGNIAESYTIDRYWHFQAKKNSCYKVGKSCFSNEQVIKDFSKVTGEVYDQWSAGFGDDHVVKLLKLADSLNYSVREQLTVLRFVHRGYASLVTTLVFVKKGELDAEPIIISISSVAT